MYQIKFHENVLKEFEKMDKYIVKIIKNWIVKNLENTYDPRLKGKELKGNLKGIWRYRIGDYRLFAKINDKELLIFFFEVGHRKEIYKKK